MTAKVQVREENINLIVQEVKPIQNVNLVILKLLEDLQFEEMIYLKELLAKITEMTRLWLILRMQRA